MVVGPPWLHDACRIVRRVVLASVRRAAFTLAHWLHRLAYRLDEYGRARSMAQHPAHRRFCSFHGFIHEFDGIADGAVCHHEWPVNDVTWADIVARLGPPHPVD